MRFNVSFRDVIGGKEMRKCKGKVARGIRMKKAMGKERE